MGRKCVHCNHVLDDVLNAPRAPVDCPRCGTECEFESIGRAIIDLCRTCGGAWLDRGELEDVEVDLTDRSTATAAWEAIEHAKGASAPTDRATLRCAICSKPMDRRHWHGAEGVVLDACPRHGVWLDRSDLLVILEAIATGRIAALDRRESERQTTEERWKTEVRLTAAEEAVAAAARRIRRWAWHSLWV